MLTVTLDSLDTKFSEVHTIQDDSDFNTLNIVIEIDSPEIDELLSNSEISRHLVAEIDKLLSNNPTINFLQITHKSKLRADREFQKNLLALLPADVLQELVNVVKRYTVLGYEGVCYAWPDEEDDFDMPRCNALSYDEVGDECWADLVYAEGKDYAIETREDLIKIFHQTRAVLLVVVAVEDTTESVNKVPLDVLLHMFGFLPPGGLFDINAYDDEPFERQVLSRIAAMPISRLLPSISPAERRALEARHKVDADRDDDRRVVATKSPKRK